MDKENVSATDLVALKAAVDRFAVERDWDQFHSPKNLAMALSAEAGELLEVFQWMTESASAEKDPALRQRAAEEMSDVLIYLLRMSTKLEIDLVSAAFEKLQANAEKYPVEKSKGSSAKYTEYE